MSDDFTLDGCSPRRPPAGDGGESAWDLDDAPAASAPPGDREPPSPSPPEGDEALNALLMQSLGEDNDDEGSKMPALDIVRLLKGCWHRRFLIAGVAVTVSALFVLLALTQIQHTWTATTVLLKRKTVDELTLGEGKSFQPQSFSLPTLLDTLKLPSSLDEVMTRSGLQVRRTTFSAAIGITLGRESEVLLLKTTWEDPRTAATIANNMAAVFMEKTVDIQRRDAQEALEYYSAQLEQGRTARQEADAALLSFEQAHGLSNFDAETKARLGALARLEGQYQAQQSEAEALRESTERLQAKIAAQPEMVIEQTIYRSPLKQRLNDYEWELREARSRYTADNPKVQKLQQKVNVLKRMIGDSRDESVPENSYAPNSYRQELQLKLDELERSIRVADANAGALARTIDDMRSKLAFLNVREKEFLRLQSRQQASRALEERLTQRVDEARLQALRAEPAFDVLEPAMPPDEPNPSGRKLVAVGGAVIGAGLGLGIALLLELLDPLVRTRRDGIALSGTALCLEWPESPDGKMHPIIDDDLTEGIFRQLVNELEAQDGAGNWLSLAVISAGSDEGQAPVAANLALTFSGKERSTLLIDAAMAGEQNAAQFTGIDEGAAGLYDVLSGTHPLRDAVSSSDQDRLRVVGAGATKDDGLKLLGSRRMVALVDAMRKTNGHVIYSLPGATGNETVLEAAGEIGGAILVMRSGISRRAEVKQLVEILRARGITMAAACVVDVPEKHQEKGPAAASGGRMAKLISGVYDA